MWAMWEEGVEERRKKCKLRETLSNSLYNLNQKKVGTVWKTQIKKESSDF